MDRKSSAGLYGRIYSFTHDLGIYRSCAIAGVYQIPLRFSSTAAFENVLKHALAKTIDRHPELCYGMVSKSEEEEAHLYRLPEIRWDDLVEIQNQTSEEDNDLALDNVAGQVHDRLFSDQQRKPAWKLVVLRHKKKSHSQTLRTDIMFLSHHTISDGSSCLAFQKTLEANLYDASLSTVGSTSSRWPYVVPDDISKPVFIEDKLPFSKFQEAFTETKKSTTELDPWTANPPQLTSIESVHTKVLSLFVTFKDTGSVLAYCRQRGLTLTGLLHGLIVVYLAKTIPNAQTFRASTPMSLRAFTKISKDELVNHVTSLANDWSPEHVSILRRCDENSEEEETSIAAIAQTFQQDVRNELQRIPEYGPSSLAGELSVAKDLEKFVEQALRSPRRGKTYELSNVGLLKLPAREEGNKEDAIVLEKLVFTQSATVTGPATECSVVSIERGPLCISFSYQEGIIADDLMHGLRDYLRRRLSGLGPSET